MNVYETFTTVGEHGDIHLAGIPFQPGAEVEVVISPKPCHALPTADGGDRLRSLFAALDCARNQKPIGPLKRDELYDRNHVH